MGEIIELLGSSTYDFTDEKSGRQVAGIKLHYAKESTIQGFSGRESGSISISLETAIRIKAQRGIDFYDLKNRMEGEIYEIFFNDKGKFLMMTPHKEIITK